MADFVIERSTTIAAPPSAVFPLLIDFAEWRKWSPWEDVDPDLQRQYSEPSGGVGASYGWSGNKKAGEGRMEITGAQEPSQVSVQLDFIKPWKATNAVLFELTDRGGSTDVRWIMSGKKSLIMRVMPVDKFVGKDFEKGLAQLKAQAEGAAA